MDEEDGGGDDDEGGMLSGISHQIYLIRIILGWMLAAVLVIMVTSILTYCHTR